jgi:hypothetical protein
MAMGKLLDHKETIDLALAVLSLVAVVLVGVMAIVVSKSANKIADAQLKVARVAIEPQLRFLWEEHYEEGQRVECVKIFNDGGPIIDFWVWQRTILALHKDLEVRHVPGYYLFDRLYTGDNRGLLAEFATTTNRSGFYGEHKNATQALDVLNAELHGEIRIEPLVYLEISFQNVLGERSNVMYLVNRTETDRFWQGPAVAQRVNITHELLTTALHDMLAIRVIDASAADEVREVWPRLKDLTNVLTEGAG